MDKQVRNLLITLGVAVVIMYIARPKNSRIDGLGKKPNLDPPRKISSEAKDLKKNANIAIQAMRSALNANESQENIDKLQQELKNEMGLKVLFTENNKLKATNLEGKLITKER